MSSKKLLWIDCEMTGLHAFQPPADLPEGATWIPDRILELAALVTDGELNILDEGIELIVKTDKFYLDSMHEWCINQHGKTGLTSACLASTTPLSEADTLVSAYVKKHFPSSPAILAGSSVHADRTFINKDLPKLASLLHYRIVDVSSVKELAARWYPDLRLPRREVSEHRALSDIKDSITELKGYKERIFRTEALEATEGIRHA